jgi:DNA-binding PadR family transcriptional regulator
MKHDPMEMVVLAVLADGPRYGYAITKEASARSGGEVKLSPGVLYPMLALLEKQGLITSEWEEVRADRESAVAEAADGEARGRRRKWYKLSAKGKKRLAQRVEAHRAYQRMLEAFLGGEAKGAGGEGVRS